MSGITAAGVLAAAAVAGVGASIYTGVQSANAQKDATAKSTATAKAAATASEQANNQANQKSANGTALLAANQDAAGAGQSGTMLTGSGGIDPSLLQLGKTTLLGGGG